jgi:MoxR-like ATPase
VSAMAVATATEEDVAAFRALWSRVGDSVEVAVYGKRPVVDLVLVALFAGGHVLIEDMPGTGGRHRQSGPPGA